MNKFISLNIKIVLPVLFILIIVFFTSSFLIIDREYNDAKNTLINNSESYASLSINTYIDYFKDYEKGIGFLKFSEFIDNLMKLNKDITQIQILDVNGKIFFDSDEIIEGQHKEVLEGERFLDEENTDRSSAFTLSKVINKTGNNIDIIVPYFDEWDRHDYSVRFIFSLSNLDHQQQEMYSTLLIYAGIFIIISFILIFILFNRFITSPIGVLIKGVRAMGKGKLGLESKVKSNDEIGELAETFNKLSIDLKKSQDELKQYSENLEILVTKRTEELEDKTTNLEKINKDLIKARKELDKLNKTLEKRIKERTKEVEVLLKQKDEFINQLSHDLKTPLMPLTILLPILEKQESNPKKREIYEVLKRNVEYMKNIAIKTLELAKLNSPKTRFSYQKVDLKSLIKNFINNKKPLFDSKKIRITHNVKNKIEVDADKLRLEELFTNLVENSIKYSKEKGVIALNTEIEGDFVKISIKDNGIGMTKTQIKHAFDEFYKADESRHDFHSSGLGMTISKKIVERHNGKIWIESPGLNKGITVFFTLPIYNDRKSKKN
ncbi:MAG: HAMP domain-containing protein [Thermoplasmatales archaeon]|nr:MAG: HAMP domain-containing protein [Thermoplasmatales archaeon]